MVMMMKMIMISMIAENPQRDSLPVKRLLRLPPSQPSSYLGLHNLSQPGDQGLLSIIVIIVMTRMTMMVMLKGIPQVPLEFIFKTLRDADIFIKNNIGPGEVKCHHPYRCF